MKFCLCQSEIGWIGLAFSERGLSALSLRASAAAAEEEMRLLGAEGPVPSHEADGWPERLSRYLGGENVSLSEGLDLEQGTPFQRRVWRTLLEIPRGETRTYQWVAERVGKPRAARAVGQAVGANPLWLAVPCHRVVASDGSLGGYGGGLSTKRRLLEIEGAV